MNSLQLCFENIKLNLVVSEKEYEIFVHTGNVSGAGTDANVFCTLFGENGDSGERKLKDSATHRNKFERGCVSQALNPFSSS